MRKGIALVVALLIMVLGGRYSWQTWQGDIQPVLATWIIFAVAVSLSWMTYWSTKRRSVIANVANAADLVAIWLILMTVVTSGNFIRRWFNPVEVGCLIGATGIVVFWRRTRSHAVANVLVQAMMSVAYVPTLYQLWHADRSTEPLSTWFITWTSSVGAMASAILAKDLLALAYAGRGFLFVTAVIALILRLS